MSDRLDEHSHRRLSLKRRGKDFWRQLAQREQVRGIHRDDGDGDHSEAPRYHRNRENQGQSPARSRTSTQLHSSSCPEKINRRRFDFSSERRQLRWYMEICPTRIGCTV